MKTFLKSVGVAVFGSSWALERVWQTEFWQIDRNVQN